ncbi:MAG TPA: hypothetical protein VG405_13955 [Solirubrobacteraceae bacterium]|nr:hypothetical protein [Solirubrobacteraceae bacterium]
MPLEFRPSRRTFLCALAAGLAVCALLGLTGAAPARAGTQPQALLLSDSAIASSATDRASGDTRSLEQQQAEALGYQVTTVDGATWDAMTQAQFASYQLLIIGDSGCKTDQVGPGSAALQNAGTWEPAVMNSGGNKVLIGTDPTKHYLLGNAPEAPQLEENSLAYAGDVSGATGLYLDLSCSYDTAGAGTDVPILGGLVQGTGQFSVEGWDSVNACATGVNIVAATGPTGGLTDSELSDWNCSVQEAFTNFPTGYTPLVLAPNSSGFPSEYCANDVQTLQRACGAPYILVSGGGVSVSSDISLSPVSQGVPTSPGSPGSATVTATITTGGTPDSGEPVTFTVNSGPDTGRTLSATTDSGGQASFTINNSGVAGSDSVSASFTNSSGNVEEALATVNFQGPGQVNASASNLTGTEQTSLGDPTVATFTDPSSSIGQSGWTTSVNWGDGTPTDTGPAVNATGTPYQYTLSDDHTYASPGIYTVTITITDTANTADTTTVTSTAGISKGQLAVQAQPVSAIAGSGFSGEIASFTNTDTSPSASSYTATINWGDGGSSTGTIQALSGTPGAFTVTGQHTYTTPGSYTITVTVTGGDDPTTSASDQNTATVGSTPTFTVAGRGTLNLPGETFTGTIATVRYGNTSASAGGFSARINWGDGSSGTGTMTGSAGSYAVAAAHTFTGSGPYTVRVTVTDPLSRTGSATTTILVPSTVSALSIPGHIKARALLCGVKRHAKCTGLAILGSFRSGGGAVWNVTIEKPGHTPRVLGQITRKVTAGNVKLVYKVTNRKLAKRLYRMVKRHKLSQLGVQQVFTNAAGAHSQMTLFSRVTR